MIKKSPAPVGGLNYMTADNRMAETDAKLLDNWIPDAGFCRIRESPSFIVNVLPECSPYACNAFDQYTQATFSAQGGNTLLDSLLPGVDEIEPVVFPLNTGHWELDYARNVFPSGQQYLRSQDDLFYDGCTVQYPLVVAINDASGFPRLNVTNSINEKDAYFALFFKRYELISSGRIRTVDGALARILERTVKYNESGSYNLVLQAFDDPTTGTMSFSLRTTVVLVNNQLGGSFTNQSYTFNVGSVTGLPTGPLWDRWHLLVANISASTPYWVPDPANNGFAAAVDWNIELIFYYWDGTEYQRAQLGATETTYMDFTFSDQHGFTPAAANNGAQMMLSNVSAAIGGLYTSALPIDADALWLAYQQNFTGYTPPAYCT